MATFGNTGTGTATVTPAANFVDVYRYQLTEAGDISKLSMYVTYIGGYFIGVIYDDDAGTPKNLKGTTQIYYNDWAENLWADLVFASPVHLTAGYYHIGYITDGYLGLRYDSGGTRHYQSSSYPAVPDPFSESGDGTEGACIYATYTTTANIPCRRLMVGVGL